MSETWAEKVRRLQREIAERQTELFALVLGDQTVGVGVPVVDPFQVHACDHRHYDYTKHGRRCTCGALITDFGD